MHYIQVCASICQRWGYTQSSASDRLGVLDAFKMIVQFQKPSPEKLIVIHIYTLHSLLGARDPQYLGMGASSAAFIFSILSPLLCDRGVLGWPDFASFLAFSKHMCCAFKHHASKKPMQQEPKASGNISGNPEVFCYSDYLPRPTRD